MKAKIAYQSPRIEHVSSSSSRLRILALPLAQYFFVNFSGDNIFFPASGECVVEGGFGGLGMCFEGNVDLLSFRIIINENGAPFATLTIDGVNCLINPDPPGPGDACQGGDTFILCSTSLTFNPLNQYILQLQHPSPNNEIADTSEICVAT